MSNEMRDHGAEAYIDVLQDRLIETREKLLRIAEHVGEWDDQEVRDEIERVIEEMDR